eukprot:3255231-Rhodomonas_salina.3
MSCKTGKCVKVVIAEFHFLNIPLWSACFVGGPVPDSKLVVGIPTRIGLPTGDEVSNDFYRVHCTVTRTTVQLRIPARNY